MADKVQITGDALVFGKQPGFVEDWSTANHDELNILPVLHYPGDDLDKNIQPFLIVRPCDDNHKVNARVSQQSCSRLCRNALVDPWCRLNTQSDHAEFIVRYPARPVQLFRAAPARSNHPIGRDPGDTTESPDAARLRSVVCQQNRNALAPRRDPADECRRTLMGVNELNRSIFQVFSQFVRTANRVCKSTHNVSPGPRDIDQGQRLKGFVPVLVEQ